MLYVRLAGLWWNCYNPESAGSQAPGPDACKCRRRSDIAYQGGQYVLTVVSVVIHASAGEATSAQAMAWCMGGSPFVCVYSHALGTFNKRPNRRSDLPKCTPAKPQYKRTA